MRKNLRRARNALGLSLDDLAKNTGIGKSTLGNYETGRADMSQEKVAVLAGFLKTEPAEIDFNDIVPASSVRELYPEHKPEACPFCELREKECAAKDKEIEWLRSTITNLQENFRAALSAPERKEKP